MVQCGARGGCFPRTGSPCNSQGCSSHMLGDSLETWQAPRKGCSVSTGASRHVDPQAPIGLCTLSLIRVLGCALLVDFVHPHCKCQGFSDASQVGFDVCSRSSKQSCEHNLGLSTHILCYIDAHRYTERKDETVSCDKRLSWTVVRLW